MNCQQPAEERLSIKQWAEDDRPREKMMQKGAQALSDAELLAILIGSGNAKESAVELSKRILQSCRNNLNELARMTIPALCKNFKGIGSAKAVTIAACLELGKRRNQHNEVERPQITSAKEAYELFKPMLLDLPHEEFWVAFLNRQNRVMKVQKIGQGGIVGTVIDIRIIIQQALEQNAVAILLAHNHPSGGNTPSMEDKAVTTKIRDAAKLFDIAVLDHIIVAHTKYISFADEALL